MPDEIHKVERYSVLIPHKSGEGARLLAALRNAGVNLIAFWGYPYRAARARLEFIPENGAAFVAAAKNIKLKLSKKRTAFHIPGRRPPRRRRRCPR